MRVVCNRCCVGNQRSGSVLSDGFATSQGTSDSLGDVRKVILEDARKIARQRFAQVELGVDPAAESTAWWSRGQGEYARVSVTAALALRSGHPAASKCYKLISDIPVVGQSSKPHVFTYVAHVFLVGGHGECSLCGSGGSSDRSPPTPLGPLMVPLFSTVIARRDAAIKKRLKVVA
jgi:hypothetical protein